MAASAHGDRVAVQHGTDRLTYEELQRAAWQVPSIIGEASYLAFVGPNELSFPIAIFGAAAAEIPFIPLNYRLADEQLNDMLSRHEGVVVIAEKEVGQRLGQLGHRVIESSTFAELARRDDGAEGETPFDGDGIWILLYTSGTTAAPKAAVMRHRHLTSYVLGSVEFGSAELDDAVLVTVPPYHIAGVANLLSNLYLGRRVVYLEHFAPETWLETVRSEQITHAMVVPTMLARLCESLKGQHSAATPSLKSLSYGGARTPLAVVERVMELFPGTGLVNAYGLTETSSTIAVLGPEDHRASLASSDPAVRARLSSAGKVLPTVEVGIRQELAWLSTGEVGDIWVRGDQVSGEYQGLSSSIDDEGWFPTKDRGWLDADGYLFVEGRSDDTIIRGGENIAPAEIEDVLLQEPSVAKCAVVGFPDEEWGERIAAVVVLHEGAVFEPDTLRSFVRERLRGSKTPDMVRAVDELPYTETGKLLRRVVLADLMAEAGTEG
jgi:acyl-CoA synthetase (AMP-forming)/AMP-acid ligase II